MTMSGMKSKPNSGDKETSAQPPETEDEMKVRECWQRADAEKINYWRLRCADLRAQLVGAEAYLNSISNNTPVSRAVYPLSAAPVSPVAQSELSEYGRLTFKDALEQIAAVATDNRSDSCDHRMAINFIASIIDRLTASQSPEHRGTQSK